jgi:hypothetical protein
MYYNLPFKSFKVDVIVEKQTLIKGPLSDYTEKYFGNVQYIKDDKIVFKIKNIQITEQIGPDESRSYFIPSKYLKNISIQTTETGVISGINTTEEVKWKNEEKLNVTENIGFDNKEINVPIQLKFVEKSETVIESQFTPDSTLIERAFIKRVIVEKSKEELAKETAGLIQKFREERHLLVTAPEDRILEGSAYQYLLEKMKKYEDEYVQLFLGYQQSEMHKYQFNFIPNPSNTEKILFKFSSREGLLPANSLNGKNVSIGISNYIAENSIQQNNNEVVGIPYILPNEYLLKISWDGETLFNEYTDIPQLNRIKMFELQKPYKTQLKFDVKTGKITNIINK